MVFLEQRNEQSFDNQNLGYRNASNETPDLAVKSGDVILINFSAKFKFTSGTGNDDVRFRISTSGCATTTNTDTYEYEGYDGTRNVYFPVGGNFMWTANCNGNVKFRLLMDSNSDSDDASALGDVVIVATRF